jgi:hypothetical protein
MREQLFHQGGGCPRMKKHRRSGGRVLLVWRRCSPTSRRPQIMPPPDCVVADAVQYNPRSRRAAEP